MKRSLVLTSMLTISLAASLAGCRDTEPQSADVLGTIYPLAWVAQSVTGARAQTAPLTPPGVEPHDLELTPKQVVRLESAKLVVYVRGLQPAVDASLPASRALDVAPAGERDPHVWLDPKRMQTITALVAKRLTEIDPDRADRYRANARQVGRQLAALDKDFAAGLARCESRTIVTSHDAFGHLARRYDLKQIPIAGIDPANEPSARQLAGITDLVRREKVSTVFTEELVSPAVARTVARSTGATVATLDPLESQSDPSADYLSLMRNNLAAIRKANRCQ